MGTTPITWKHCRRWEQPPSPGNTVGDGNNPHHLETLSAMGTTPIAWKHCRRWEQPPSPGNTVGDGNNPHRLETLSAMGTTPIAWKHCRRWEQPPSPGMTAGRTARMTDWISARHARQRSEQTEALLQIKSVQRHDFAPGGNKIIHELLLTVCCCIHLSDCAQFRT